MPTLDDINSAEETAAYLKLAPFKVIELARQQKIGALKEGRTWVFPRAAIEKYVAANTREAKPGNPWGLTDASAKKVRGSAA